MRKAKVIFIFEIVEKINIAVITKTSGWVVTQGICWLASWRATDLFLN